MFQSPQSGHGWFKGDRVHDGGPAGVEFQSPQSGHGWFKILLSTVCICPMLVFQSPQSGHGWFKEHRKRRSWSRSSSFNPLNRGMGGLTKGIVKVLCRRLDCFNPLNRGMGGLRGFTACGMPGCSKFQSPQSGHGWFKFTATSDAIYSNVFGFNPLNRGKVPVLSRDGRFNVDGSEMSQSEEEGFQSPQSGHGVQQRMKAE